MLMPQPPYGIQQGRQHHAEQDAGSKWEIEARVFSAISNVTGQAAERKIGSAQQHQRDSRHGDDCTQKNQQLSQIRHISILAE